MRHKKYIYTNRKHSLRAVMSVILGVISAVSLVVVVYLSYLMEGNILPRFGLVGLLSAMFSLIGLVLALITVGEKVYFKFFSVLGILLNLAALGFVAFLLQLGL